MKNTYIAFILICTAVLCLFSCNQAGKNVEVDIKNIPAQQVLLEEIKGPDFIHIDSVKIEASKPFSLNAHLGEERMYRLTFAQNKYVMLALEKGDKLKVTGDWNKLEDYNIEGSTKSAIVKELVSGTRQSIIDIRTYQVVFDSLKKRGDKDRLAEAQKDFQKNNQAFISFLKAFADTSNSAVASLMAVILLTPN